MTDAIALDGVTKRYMDVTAVKNVRLAALQDEIFGIVGPSGAGKSTALRLMDLIEEPTSGTVWIQGKKASARSRNADMIRKRIGMVLQKPVVLNRSVENNLAYPLQIRGFSDQEVASKVDKELRRFGLAERRHKNARTLSGGEMQRLCFARAMVHDPSVLLLDEFAANLDPANVALLEEEIRRYIAERPGRSVVLVTHNMFQAKRMCDRVALMWDGEVIEVAEKRKFFESPDDPRTAKFVSGDLVF